MALAQAQHGPGYDKHPDYEIRLEPCAKRLRVHFNGAVIADSTNVCLMYESHHLPVYYFPLGDLRRDLLEKSEHHTYCPFKGEASYYSVRVADKVAKDAVWYYGEPYTEVADVAGYVAFYWDRMEQWFEEDEEVFVHARDPYVRLDMLPSSRRVQIIVDGQEVADSSNAIFLFETNLPVRYYIPRDDVDGSVLQPSEKQTRCPYKGRASYHHIDVHGSVREDLVWTYREPTDECARIKDLLCFFNEKVDAILIDGEEMPRPQTKWS